MPKPLRASLEEGRNRRHTSRCRLSHMRIEGYAQADEKRRFGRHEVLVGVDRGLTSGKTDLKSQGNSKKETGNGVIQESEALSAASDAPRS